MPKILFYWILPSNEADKDHNDRHHQENMDEAAECDRCHESEEPQNEENYCNRHQHKRKKLYY